MDNIGTKVKRGIKWQFITNIVGQGFTFINGIILARILSPRDFGIYGMVQLLSFFVFMFWNLGLNAAMIQRKEVSEEHAHTAFTMCLAMGMFCFIVAWILAPFLARFFKEPSVTLLARIIGATFIIYSLDRVPSAFLNRNLHFKRIGFVNLLNPFVYGATAIPLALLGFGPLSFVIGVVAAAVAMAGSRIYMGVRMFHWKPKFMFVKKAAKDLLGFGIFITITDTVNYFLWNTPKIIIGRFFNATDLGYFNRASNLSYLPLRNIQTNVGSVLLPAFSNIQDNAEQVRNWFRKFNFFTYLLIAPILMFFAFFPSEFIVGLFGQKWVSAAPLLIWMSLGILISAPNIYFNNILKAVGKPNIDFCINLIRLGPFVVSLIWAMQWGLKGIAIALFGNSIFAIACYLFVLIRKRLVLLKDVLMSFAEPLSISFAACVVTYFLKNLFLKSINSSIVVLVSIALMYAIILLPYYLWRFFKKPEIVYLNINIRNVIKDLRK